MTTWMPPINPTSTRALGLCYGLLIACDTSSQLLFKTAAGHVGAASMQSWPAFLDFIVQLLQQPALLAGGLSLLLAFACWMWLMARAELSQAHLISCLVYATVPLCSVWLFAETVSRQQVLGIALITTGAALSAL